MCAVVAVLGEVKASDWMMTSRTLILRIYFMLGGRSMWMPHTNEYQVFEQERQPCKALVSKLGDSATQGSPSFRE